MYHIEILLVLFQFIGFINSSFLPHEFASRSYQHQQPDSITVDRRQENGGQKRVPMYSKRQCKVSIGERMDCGKVGIQKGECLKRGCCWKPTDEESVPWCYHSESTQISKCTSVHDEERIACGSNGVQINECLKQKCCWRPTETAGAPWCYHRRAPVNYDTCGVPIILPNVNLRIVGGVDAIPNSWPWMVSLQSEGFHFCGASLVNEDWILTAAHCNPQLWGGQEPISAVFGVFNVKTMEPENYTVSINWAQRFPHPKYGSINGYDHDHMLVKLEHPVEFNEAIQPVCLAKSNEGVKPGTRNCYATGWGSTFLGSQGADKLQQAKIPIMDNAVCNQEDWYNGAIDDSMICAGYEEGGRSVCHGDSGGPLVCFENKRWILQGIVSWGKGCAWENAPALYGSVSYGYEWIVQTIKENSSD